MKPFCKDAGECWSPCGEQCRVSGQTRTRRARCNLRPEPLAELQKRHAQRGRELDDAERAIKSGGD